MDVLVIDIGGSSVKLWHTGHEEHRKFESGKTLTPDAMVKQTLDTVEDWKFEAVALGLPSRVSSGRAVEDPPNLGPGWVSYHFSSAFGKPVRLMNDACLQALGSYDGGRMLFLGLGTGVGSALVTEHVVVPLELGCLPYCPDETLFDRLGASGLEKHGEQSWLEAVTRVTTMLRAAFSADYVLLGGGNAKRVQPLPQGARRGGNEDAFTGGFRLWEEIVEPHDRSASSAWRVVR